MAIQFVGGAIVEKTSINMTIPLNSGLTGGISSSVQAGDLVIAAQSSTGAGVNPTLGINSGYTNIAGQLYTNDTFDTALLVAYKVMPSTPDTSINFTTNFLTTSGGFHIIYVFRGVDTSNPLDVTSTTATGLSSALANPPAITPVTAGAVVVVTGAAGHGLGVVNFGTTGLTSVFADSVNATNDLSAAIGYIPWAGGTVDAAAWSLTGSTSTHSWNAATMALRPAPGGGNIKVWNGSAWVAKPVKFWNGSAWITKPMKRWNGSAWVTLPY